MELTLWLGVSAEQDEKSSEKILQTMRKNPHITTAELAGMLGISERAVWKHIANLKTSGKILREGSYIVGEWKVLK